MILEDIIKEFKEWLTLKNIELLDHEIGYFITLAYTEGEKKGRGEVIDEIPGYDPYRVSEMDEETAKNAIHEYIKIKQQLKDKYGIK